MKKQFLVLSVWCLVGVFASCSSQSTHPNLSLPLPSALTKAAVAGDLEAHLVATNGTETEEVILDIVDGQVSGTLNLKPGTWTIEIQFYQVAPSGNLISIAFISFGETSVGSDGSSLSYTPADIQFSESTETGIVSSISPSISSGCVSRFDCDGDGINNFEEMKWGSNPEDSSAFPFCGNEKKELLEQCDDGNTDDADACTNLCLDQLAIVSLGTEKTIQNGESAELTWTVAHADSISLNQNIGALDIAATSLTVKPSLTTTYKLSASRAGKVVTKEVTVHVNYPPVLPTALIPPTRSSASDTVFSWADTPAINDDTGCATLSYTVEVQKADGTAVVTKTGLSSKTFDVASLIGSEKIEPRTDYKWRVISQDNCGASVATAFQSFTTKDEGLVGWWRFDEGSGTTAKDSSGNGNDGTLQGANGLPTRTAGVSGNALSFDGVDDLVDVGNKSNGSLLKTVSFWVYSNSEINKSSIPGRQPLTFGFDEDKYQAIFLGAHSGTITDEVAIAHRGSSHAYYYSKSVIASGWNMLTFVWNGSSQDIYINGIQQEAYTYDPYSTPWVWKDVNIGWDEGGGGDYAFEGLIDEVAIYNRALTVTEIRDSCQQHDPTGNTCASDDVPTQKTPSGGLTLPPTRAYLSWEAGIVPSGKILDHYLVCYATNGSDISPTSACLNPTNTDQSYLVLDSLITNNTGYRWKVKSCYNASGTDCSAYTPVWSFATDDSVVAWWKMNGNLLDSSGHENNGTFFGGTPQYTEGTFGQALLLDGVDDYVVVSDSDSLDISPADGITAEVWALVDNTEQVHSFVLKHVPGYGGLWLQVGLYGDPHVFQMETAPAGPFASNSVVMPGEWTHIVFTGDADQETLYLDGTLDAERTENHFVGTVNDNPLYIGIAENGVTMKGQIGELILYKGVLSHEVAKNNFCALEVLAGTNPLPSVCLE